MNAEKRKFNKVMKARKRRAAYLKSKNSNKGKKIDLQKFINSLPKQPQARKKESIFQWLKNKFF